MYQNYSYPPAQPQYSMNVYTDIAQFFCEVNQALNFSGTHCFEERKREYWRQSNDIIGLATSLSQFQMIPMKIARSSGLGIPLSELESDILRNIILQIQISENNYWNNFVGVDARLKDLVHQFVITLQNQLPDFSMERYVRLFESRYPEELRDRATRNKVTLYLMVSELEYELIHTAFYHVYPSLKNVSSGKSLYTILQSLNADLMCLQNKPGFYNVSRELAFGNSNLLNVNRGFTGDVVDSYLDKILLILSQVKCITNSQNVDYINGFISTIISLKNRIMTQPELQQQISLIREYYQLVSDLSNGYVAQRDMVMNNFRRLRVIYEYFLKLGMAYAELCTDMQKTLGSLLDYYHL